MPKKWLSLEESEAYLNQAFYGRLATAVDNQPYIVPVNFVYHQSNIYIHSSPLGRKLMNIQQNPRVCFEVSQPIKLLTGDKPCQFGVRYWSVLVFGQAKLIEDQNLKRRALELLTNKYATDISLPAMDPDDIQNVAVIQIDIETITGKANVDVEPKISE